MTWVRLRQVAVVANDRDAVVDALRAAFGIEVAYEDPGVAVFGLHNAVLPVGNQFIEVVAPTRSGTAGGRQLQRLGGDGGYMVICHTDDQGRVRARADELGVRVAFEHDDQGYRIMQLHPADTGGTFLEIDFQPGGHDPSGPWTPAGPEWQRARRTDVVDGIVGVTVQSTDPHRTASRWAEISGCPLDGGLLHLDGATVTFVDGPLDSLVGVTLSAPQPFDPVTIGGVTFTTDARQDA